MMIPATSAWSEGAIELFGLKVDDVTEHYVAWLNNSQVNRYLESRFEHHTLASTRSFVNDCVSSEHKLLFGIRYREQSGRHVGNIKLEIDMRHKLAEVGILIGEEDVHGKGVATDAIRAVARIAREDLKLRKLSAGCYASNIGSERAFVKAGFEVEGHRKEHVLSDGKPENLTLMGLIL